MQDYRKLKVWQRAMGFTVELYKATGFFPKGEQFGLVSQIRRASSSVCLNIAEGCGSDSHIEFKRYLRVALESLYETKTGLELAIRLGFGKDRLNRALLAEADEISAMLASFIKRMKY